MSKLSKRPPEWHAQIAAELSREFAETNELVETARRRRARLGLMFIFVKEMGKADQSIPHGQFGPWLEKNCPAIKRSTAGDYIAEAKSLTKVLGWQNSEIRKFDLPPHRLLIADSDTISEKDRARQKALVDAINQNRFRAITKYSQVKLVDDESVPSRGRRKGEGGNTKEQRARAKELEAAELLRVRKAKALEFAKWLDDEASPKGIGEFRGSEEWNRLKESMRDALDFMNLSDEPAKGGEQ